MVVKSVDWPWLPLMRLPSVTIFRLMRPLMGAITWV